MDKESFRWTTSITLSSIFSFFLLSTDVPFTNGYFSKGLHAMLDISCSGITCDSGLFLLIHFIHSLYKSQKQNQITLYMSIRILYYLIMFCF